MLRLLRGHPAPYPPLNSFSRFSRIHIDMSICRDYQSVHVRGEPAATARATLAAYGLPLPQPQPLIDRVTAISWDAL